MSRDDGDLTDEEVEEIAQQLAARIIPQLEPMLELALQQAARRPRRRRKPKKRRQRQDPAPPGALVYFLRCRSTGLIKIGYSADLRRRVTELRNVSPTELELLGVVSAQRWRERSLHERFSALRVRLEWFQPGEELLRFIAEHATPPPGGL